MLAMPCSMQPHSPVGVGEGLGMRISQMLNNRVMRLRVSVSVLLKLHTQVWPSSSGTWKHAGKLHVYQNCWLDVQLIHLHTYIGQNKLLASLTRAISFLFWQTRLSSIFWFTFGLCIRLTLACALPCKCLEASQVARGVIECQVSNSTSS